MREPDVNSYEVHVTLSYISKADALDLARGIQALVQLKADESGVLLYAMAVSHIKGFDSNG
jgi:hypothetical protein